MKLVEFHVDNSGFPISINPENVCRVGAAFDTEVGSFICQVDGSSFDVREGYLTVIKMLEGDE